MATKRTDADFAPKWVSKGARVHLTTSIGMSRMPPRVVTISHLTDTGRLAIVGETGNFRLNAARNYERSTKSGGRAVISPIPDGHVDYRPSP